MACGSWCSNEMLCKLTCLPQKSPTRLVEEGRFIFRMKHVQGQDLHLGFDFWGPLTCMPLIEGTYQIRFANRHAQVLRRRRGASPNQGIEFALGSLSRSLRGESHALCLGFYEDRQTTFFEKHPRPRKKKKKKRLQQRPTLSTIKAQPVPCDHSRT